MILPLTHFYVANTCADYPGWSGDKAIPPLLTDFAKASGQEEPGKIAEEIQKMAYDLTPAVSWGIHHPRSLSCIARWSAAIELPHLLGSEHAGVIFLP
jgi:hypothetical protein